MISISSITQSTTFAIIIDEDKLSVLNTNVSRISRVATLDGGASLIHSGYSDGDRIFSISGRINETQASTLWAIFKSEAFVLVSIPDGLYYSLIQRLKTDNGDLAMTILVKNREDV